MQEAVNESLTHIAKAKDLILAFGVYIALEDLKDLSEAIALLDKSLELLSKI